MLNQKKLEIFLVKICKSLAKQFLEVDLFYRLPRLLFRGLNYYFRQLLKIALQVIYGILTSSMLLSLEIANAGALLFTRLIATLRFLPKSFCFFWGRIARYDGSKETRNLSSKISQITYKAIFRSCLNKKNANCSMSNLRFSLIENILNSKQLLCH